MDQKKACFVMSCIALTCLLSISLIQGRIDLKSEKISSIEIIHGSGIYKGINITSPAKLDSWVAGSKHDITWTSNLSQVSVSIGLLNATNFLDMTIIELNAYGGGFSGYYSWTIPSNQTAGNYIVVISSNTYGSNSNGGSDMFSITRPSSNPFMPGFPVEFTLLGLGIGILGLLGIALKRRNFGI